MAVADPAITSLRQLPPERVAVKRAFAIAVSLPFQGDALLERQRRLWGGILRRHGWSLRSIGGRSLTGIGVLYLSRRMRGVSAR